jgi:hypothetical protein
MSDSEEISSVRFGGAVSVSAGGTGNRVEGVRDDRRVVITLSIAPIMTIQRIRRFRRGGRVPDRVVPPPSVVIGVGEVGKGVVKVPILWC